MPVDRLDVVILQDVSTLLQYNVIRGGSAFYARTPAARREYELHVERRYDDEGLYRHLTHDIDGLWAFAEGMAEWMRAQNR